MNNKNHSLGALENKIPSKTWIITQPHITLTEKIAGARGKGGDRSDGIPASKKLRRCVSWTQWGIDVGSLPPQHSRPAGSPPPPHGEKEEDDGNTSQWREARWSRCGREQGAMMRVDTSGGDSPLGIPTSTQLLEGDRSASSRREIHCASLRRRALKWRRWGSGESCNWSGELNERVTGRSL
jgi:hypothetical protein